MGFWDPWSLGSVFQVGKISIHSNLYPQSKSQIRYLSNQVRGLLSQKFEPE